MQAQQSNQEQKKTAPSSETPQKPEGDSSELITTGVDDLIALLSEFPKLSLDEVSRRLKVAPKILKSWIDFLVEEKILGIEYSFTTPYIYLNKPLVDEKTKKVKEIKLSYDVFKQEFFEKARGQKIPEEKIAQFWEAHLKPVLEANKDFFIREVKKRNLPKGEELWQQYTLEVMKA
jgi:hypothetical protein